MTATERLRQLLDERGVKWEEPDPYQDATAWVGSGNIEYVAHEGISFDGPTGRLILFCLTPEQVVEATLGRGTCRIDYHFGEWYCTGCGEMVGTSDPTSELCIDGNAIELWSFCPNCGRRIEQ